MVGMKTITFDYEKRVQKRTCVIKEKVVCFVEYDWFGSKWNIIDSYAISIADLKKVMAEIEK